MPKSYTQYVCEKCGRVSAAQMGKCPQCGAWNSQVEQVIAAPTAPSATHAGRPSFGAPSKPRRLSEITGDVEERLPLSIGEFSRVLGGGVVPGSIILIGGDPGIGKSTLLLQLALEMARQASILYVSGEESERQIKMRALRLLRTSPAGPDSVEQNSADSATPALPHDLYLVTETNLEVILGHINDLHPQILILELGPDHLPARARYLRRLGHPGARDSLPPARAGQVVWPGGLPDRARHQRRRDRWPAHP